MRWRSCLAGSAIGAGPQTLRPEFIRSRTDSGDPAPDHVAGHRPGAFTCSDDAGARGAVQRLAAEIGAEVMPVRCRTPAAPSRAA